MKYGVNCFERNYLELRRFPNALCEWIRGKFIVCELETKSPVSQNKYKLCINYEKGWTPAFWIVEPNLLVGKVIHTFHGCSNKLCLFKTSNWRWTDSCNIVDTMLLWAFMWIVYYEDFCKTGKWMGAEATHNLQPKDDNDQAIPKVSKRKPSFLKKNPVRLVEFEKYMQKGKRK